MKKWICVLLALVWCVGLISCGETDKSDPAEGGSTLSGETVWLPAVAAYRSSDGTHYEKQTVEMVGEVAKIRNYAFSNGKRFLLGGYDVDLSRTNPLEIVMVKGQATTGSYPHGLRRFTVFEDNTVITEEYAQKRYEGIDGTTTYTLTYDAQDRIETLVITEQYGDGPATKEERLYAYGETGYTISYVDAAWSYTEQDETLVRRHVCYEIPYEGDRLTMTETYRGEDGSPYYPIDFYTDSDQKLEKLVYEINRQGFCTGNTLYFQNGKTQKNQDFYENRCFSAEFNENGMPTKYVTTLKDGTNLQTSTFTYDANGNLSVYHEESEEATYSVEFQWEKYPAELKRIFALADNTWHVAVRGTIHEHCPQLLLGPQELLYQQAEIFK